MISLDPARTQSLEYLCPQHHQNQSGRLGQNPVADAGFLERGFCCNIIAREACAKNRGHAHFWLNHTHFRAFMRETWCLTCQSHPFWSGFLLRYSKVSHRSRFLSSSDREGVLFSLSSVLLSTSSRPKGGFHGTVGTPLNPPLKPDHFFHSLLANDRPPPGSARHLIKLTSAQYT